MSINPIIHPGGLFPGLLFQIPYDVMMLSFHPSFSILPQCFPEFLFCLVCLLVMIPCIQVFKGPDIAFQHMFHPQPLFQGKGYHIPDFPFTLLCFYIQKAFFRPRDRCIVIPDINFYRLLRGSVPTDRDFIHKVFIAVFPPDKGPHAGTVDRLCLESSLGFLRIQLSCFV